MLLIIEYICCMRVMIADIQISMIVICAKECIEYYLSLVINTNTLFGTFAVARIILYILLYI